MNDDEKAERLLLYKQQAQARWDARSTRLRTLMLPFVWLNRIGIYACYALAPLVAIGFTLLAVSAHHYYGVPVLAAVALAARPILRMIRRGDIYPAARSDAKAMMLSALALFTWWVLCIGACAASLI